MKMRIDLIMGRCVRRYQRVDFRVWIGEADPFSARASEEVRGVVEAREEVELCGESEMIVMVDDVGGVSCLLGLGRTPFTFALPFAFPFSLEDGLLG